MNSINGINVPSNIKDKEIDAEKAAKEAANAENSPENNQSQNNISDDKKEKEKEQSQIEKSDKNGINLKNNFPPKKIKHKNKIIPKKKKIQIIIEKVHYQRKR